MFDAAVYLGLFFNGKVSICLCYLWWISCYKSKHQWVEQYLVDWQQIHSGIGQKLAIWCDAEWIIYQILSSLTTFNCSEDIVNLYRLFIFDYCFKLFFSISSFVDLYHRCELKTLWFQAASRMLQLNMLNGKSTNETFLSEDSV